MDVLDRSGHLLACPPGSTSVPAFDHGWVVGRENRTPFLSYTDQASTNWSDELEHLHEEASRTHFIDVWTREAILSRTGAVSDGGVIVDLGCSTGYLLDDLGRRYPGVTLVGVDLVAAGLVKAHRLVPAARLIRADVCALPLADSSVDVVVSANLLEHIPDDVAALGEIRRVLKPGGRAVIVVPAGSSTYDYYDRFLGHERRYARAELGQKAHSAGLEVLEESYLASLLYPAFWLVKQRNQRRYRDLEGVALEQRVSADIGATKDSRVGRALKRVEERLPFELPFGIRALAVLRRGER
jgi:ubiquinone/menaquinone biosynthesis C-methylase UbiE